MTVHRIGTKQSVAAHEASLASYLAAANEKPLLRFTTAGSVDDGKSTLIGRLLHDAQCIHDDHMEALRRSGLNRSTGPLDFSLLTDGLKAEREQGITIDVAYRHFATPRRRFLIADTPGHEQYTRNMATGASTADAAVILVDARHGLTAQSRRHAYIAWLLGIRHLLIAVNKMDLVSFDQDAFERVRTALDDVANKLPGAHFHVLPVSALDGDNVATRSARTPWYDGPSLLELMETIDTPAWDTDAPLRFMVQYVIRPDLDFRGYAGRVDSGRIRAGDRVTVLPSGLRSRVKRIVTFEGDLEEAFAPMAVALVLEDELDISRGDWICGENGHPLVAQRFEASLVWMHEQPLQRGASVLLQHGATRVRAEVQEIVHRIDPNTYEAEPASQLALNQIGLVRVETASALVCDRYRDNRQTGAFVLIDPINNFTLGAGMVKQKVQTEPARRHERVREHHSTPVTPAERFHRYGHWPAVVVCRSAALQKMLERALFAVGAAVVSLEAVPARTQLRELLANGLILLVPPSTPEELEGTDWIEVMEATSTQDYVRLILSELERLGLLVSRKFLLPGEGISMSTEPKLSSAETLKRTSRHLRGTIAEELHNSLPYFSKPATGILKFHGIYQQDDRDLRKRQPERVFSAMIRVGIPGGRLSPDQYLELDRLADEAGDGTLRITSRQALQYHGVGKRSLQELISRLITIDLTSLAACGDVVRNVVCCAAPIISAERQDLMRYVMELSRALKPRTQAYFEIWLDGELAASLEHEDDPLYGETYLPRKFKIGFAYEGENTTDIYSHDLGFVAHYDGGVLAGFTVLAGGGLGQTNGVSATHPRLADPIAFVRPDQILTTAKAVVSIHRDFGNRENRRLARLKYVMEAWGVERFRQELEQRMGEALEPPRPLAWHRADDYLGWHPQGDGNWFYGLRVMNGRITDFGCQRIRSGLRELVQGLRLGVRLTAQQNLLLAGIKTEQRSEVDRMLRAHGIIAAADLPPVLRQSMACPALPTCGQAITESERVWPKLAVEIQQAWDAAGLRGEPLCVRMTGCPNGCARPYTAEIGIVGQSTDLHSLYLGGSPLGTRLTELFRHEVRLQEITVLLRPLFGAYAAERAAGERFGDWAARQGVVRLRDVGCALEAQLILKTSA